MPSYLVTGASRGIGFEFVRQLSQDPGNVVIGLVRDKAATDSKIAAEIQGSKTIHTIQADLTSVNSLKDAMVETGKITGGSLDVLIANAAYISDYSQYDTIDELGEDPKRLDEDLKQLFDVNVIGNIHLFNTFLPLIRNGQIKKVVTLSSGMSDMDLVVKYELWSAAPYSISKTAMNMAIAKYHARFRPDGILFMGVCPGMVDTGHLINIDEKQQQKLALMTQKFAEYAPNFRGMAEPKDSVHDVLKVIQNANMEVNGGRVVSHFGNDRWL